MGHGRTSDGSRRSEPNLSSIRHPGERLQRLSLDLPARPCADRTPGTRVSRPRPAPDRPPSRSGRRPPGPRTARPGAACGSGMRHPPGRTRPPRPTRSPPARRAPRACRHRARAWRSHPSGRGRAGCGGAPRRRRPSRTRRRVSCAMPGLMWRRRGAEQVAVHVREQLLALALGAQRLGHAVPAPVREEAGVRDDEPRARRPGGRTPSAARSGRPSRERPAPPARGRARGGSARRARPGAPTCRAGRAGESPNPGRSGAIAR